MCLIRGPFGGDALHLHINIIAVNITIYYHYYYYYYYYFGYGIGCVSVAFPWCTSRNGDREGVPLPVFDHFDSTAGFRRGSVAGRKTGFNPDPRTDAN